MTLRTRILVLISALVVLAGVATASVLHASARADRKNQTQPGGPRITAGAVALATGSGSRMIFRNMAWGPHRDELTTVPASNPSGPRTASKVKCLRFYAAAGTGVCLQSVHGPVQDTYRAVILDTRLRETARYDVPGIPSRARVSPSGRYAAWTAFVGGDSYAGTNFSTRAAIVDTRTGKLTPSLEAFRVVKDGRTYHAADVNFWGITFAADDRTFYATLATKGTTYLVRGDLRARTLTTLHANVECPSLSPDGTRVAYKKRVPGLSKDAPGTCTSSTCARCAKPRWPSPAASTTRWSGATTARSSTPSPATTEPTSTPSRPTARESRGASAPRRCLPRT